LGTVLAIVALPIILVLAITVAIVFGEWPFFVHQRIGRHGKLFPHVKIRTLPGGTPAYAAKDELVAGGSRFMSFLRRSHLDELPQLFLVPLGWMSLVGPRPKMPDDCEPARPDHGARRVSVRQGCTGLWQIGTHTHLRVVDAPEYDLFYLEHASLQLDAWILWRTVLQLSGLGKPRSLDSVPEWCRARHTSPTQLLPVGTLEVLTPNASTNGNGNHAGNGNGNGSHASNGNGSKVVLAKDALGSSPI
jgi:lipopolysaccharide/colanic/teichoic acid biosynthesis glycosyltransferase